MIPCLYSSSETEFTTNGLGKLSDCISCTVTEVRNSTYELEMEYPVDGIHADELATELIILAKPSDTAQHQPFRIYKVTKDATGTILVNASHISYQLNFITASSCTAVGCPEALAHLKLSATTDCPFEFSTDIEGTDESPTFNVTYPDSIRNWLGGNSGSILDVYGGEFEWDRYNVIFHSERGSDTDVRITYGKNLVSFTHETDSDSMITGVHPYWSGTVTEVDEDGNSVATDEEIVVELPEKVILLDTDLGYDKVLALDCSDQFETQPTEAQLRDYATAYLTTTTLTEADIDITVDFAALWQSPDYADIAEAEQLSLCDKATVYVSKLGIDVKCKVTETVYNVLLERYDSLTLSNTVESSRNTTFSDAISSNLSEVAEQLMATWKVELTRNYVTRASLTLSIGADGVGRLSAYADHIELEGGELVINTGNLILDADGNATFSGALEAATGTFAGELTAATGTFTGSIQVGSSSSSPSGYAFYVDEEGNVEIYGNVYMADGIITWASLDSDTQTAIESASEDASSALEQLENLNVSEDVIEILADTYNITYTELNEAYVKSPTIYSGALYSSAIYAVSIYGATITGEIIGSGTTWLIGAGLKIGENSSATHGYNFYVDQNGNAYLEGSIYLTGSLHLANGSITWASLASSVTNEFDDIYDEISYIWDDLDGQLAEADIETILDETYSITYTSANRAYIQTPSLYSANIYSANIYAGTLYASSSATSYKTTMESDGIHVNLGGTEKVFLGISSVSVGSNMLTDSSLPTIRLGAGAGSGQAYKLVLQKDSYSSTSSYTHTGTIGVTGSSGTVVAGLEFRSNGYINIIGTLSGSTSNTAVFG